MLAASYLEVHRYDGAVIQHGRRDAIVPCAVQPRDLAIVRDVWRYKFLTAPQLLELFWPAGAAWPGQRRMRKLFDAGYLERFRPLARQGSYPWTYHLGQRGHQVLQRAGLIPAGQRYYPRTIYDYGHVLHELQLNAWILALRRTAGPAFQAWDGETDINPPPQTRHVEMQLDDDWSVEDLRDPRAKLLRPDAVLTLASDGGDTAQIVLVEFDRTQRVDKNYGKFRRYDAFLCWWWLHTDYADHPAAPLVLFVCQTPEQRQRFLAAGDHELTGHLWHADTRPEHQRYPGRQRILFALEHDAHAGRLDAWQLPVHPPRHPGRDATVRCITLGTVASLAPASAA